MMEQSSTKRGSTGAVRTGLVLLGLALLAGPVRADAPTTSPAVPPAPATPVAGMGPDATDDALGGAVTISAGDDTDSLVRVRLWGQYVHASGFGAYGAIAAAKIADAKQLGSPELGALWRLRRPAFVLAARAGLVLPTAQRDDDAGWAVNLVSTEISRPADTLAAMPETTTARLALSAQGRARMLVARLELALDVPLATFDGGPTDTSLHVAGAVGVDSGTTFGLVEAVTGDDDIEVVGLTAGVHGGRASPYLGVTHPYGDTPIERVYNLTLGVRVGL